MGNEVFTETQEKQIVEVIRATVAEVLRQQEEARATPVVHAKWIPFHSEAAGDIQYCSACEIGFDARMDYCPHCGARMDGWAYDTEPQAHVEAHTERQREQLEQIRAEQAAEHDDPIRAMFRRMGAELLGDSAEPDTIFREEDAERMSWSMLALLFAEDAAIMSNRKTGRLAFPPGTRERFVERHRQKSL